MVNRMEISENTNTLRGLMALCQNFLSPVIKIAPGFTKQHTLPLKLVSRHAVFKCGRTNIAVIKFSPGVSHWGFVRDRYLF